MPSDKLSERLSDLYRQVEDLRLKSLRDPEKASEILSEALEELQVSLEELSDADEELCQQNEELTVAAEENARLLTAVQEERDRLSALVNSISDEVWFADTQKKFTLANPSALQEFHLSAEGNVGVEKLASSLEVYRPDGSSRPVEEAPPLRALQGEVVKNQEEIIKTPATGELRYRQVSSSPVRDAHGEIIGSVSVVRDITEHKRSEEALRESEEKYRLLFESMSEGFLLVEMILDDCGKPISYRYLDANPALEKLTHLKRGDIIGRDVHEVLPGVEPYWIEAFGQVAMSGKPLHVEQFSKDLGGWYDVYVFCPKPGQAALIYTNTTERKRAEVALQESVSRAEQHSNELNAALSSIVAGVIIYDKSGKIVRINDMALNMLGISSADLDPENYNMRKARIGTSKPDGTPLKTEEAPYYRALHGESILGEEVVFELQDHERLWVSTTASPIRNSKGEISGAIAIFTDITDRKLAEEKLRQSEEKYRRLFTTITEGFALAEIIQDNHGKPIDYRFIEMNPAFEKLTGITGEAAEGKTIRELVPDIKPSWIETYGKVALTGEPINFIDQSRSSGKWYETYAYSPAKGKFGLIFSDVTERKKAEEALRESEELARRRLAEIEGIYESAPIGLCVFDENLRWQRLNQRIAEINGVPIEAHLGKTPHEVVPDVGGQAEEALKHIMETGNRLDFEMSGTTLAKPGVLRFWEEHWIPMKDEEGHIIGISVAAEEITERKRMEEELRKSRDDLEKRVQERTAELQRASEILRGSEERFRVALKNSPLVVFNQDKELRYTWVYHPNPGFAEDTSLGKRDEEILPPEDASRLTEIKRRVLEKGIGERAEVRTTINGKEFFYDLTVEPLRDESGEVKGVTCSSMDITDRKLAEKELIKAKDLALEAVEAKAAFLANMSHELRTPMNAVIGFSSLLLDDSLTPDQKDYVERIRTGGEALLALINDVLDFSKMEKGKVKIEHQPLSLRHCIEEALGMVAVKANDKGLNLSHTISYGTPDTIIGDSGRLRQVLLNLLSNAVKFTDMGEISVSVSSKVIEGDKHSILFKVRDTGIGIPEEKVGMLFQPFSQLEYNLSLKRDGTGLGLAISKNLVELMGGEIWADSTPGEGSTFHFTIEAEVAPGKLIDSGRPTQAAYENLAEKKPLRILVAEDVPSNQMVLVEMLKRMGYRADMAADGCEVLQALELLPYDLVLMDVQMPEMDGLEAARQIRKRWPVWPKIIAITAYAMEGDREKCIEAGMDDYIAKPVKKDDLEAILRKYSGETA